MSIIVLCAPDAQSLAFGKTMQMQSEYHSISIENLTEAAVCRADALVLVMPDYYTYACWQMKKWISEHLACFSDKLCACLCLCREGSGGELALRSIISELLPSACLIYLSGVVCADGRICLGGNPETQRVCLTADDFCTKLKKTATLFRRVWKES